MTNCSTLPVIVNTPLEPQKIVAQCDNWITLCGKGKHKISYFLGQLNGPVTIWYDRESLEDEIYVYQNGEVIAAAPLKDQKGSMTFDYAPVHDGPGGDEIVLTHEGMTKTSRVHIHLLCPVDPCLPEFAAKPEPIDTVTPCGRAWHQSGYVRKNTFDLGDKPGRVDVIWSVVGSSLVVIYQDNQPLLTMEPDREGFFQFDYDPEKGEVYAITQGIGSVDYVFTCPYLEETPEEEVFRFACGAADYYVFNAPQLTQVDFPVTEGTIEFSASVVETAQLVFSQNNVPFYVVSGHTGVVDFTFDYMPDKGKITINTQGYGEIKVKAKCPYTAPDPIPEELDADCGSTLNTYPGFSNIRLDLKGISGDALLDLVLTDTTVGVVHTGTQLITKSGTYPIVYDKTVPLILQARGNDFQMRISCPVRKPIEATLDCGVIRNFDSLANITVRYGSTPGNTTITTSQDVTVYRDGVLVGFGRNVTFFYPGSGVVLVKCDVLDEYLTISATCPSVQQIHCGDPIKQFNAGDVVDVVFNTPAITGHVAVTVEITGNTTVDFRLGNNVVKTVTQTETFEAIWNTASALRVVSRGTGQFKLSIGCAQPIYIVNDVTKTEKVNCQPGETAGGLPNGDTFVTATWHEITWSDGRVEVTPKTYDGVCKPVAEIPIPPARWGVAMFANRLFTGGPIAAEITEEEAAYGVVANPSPSGKNYQHWTGIQQFCDQVMTHEFSPTTAAAAQIETTITVDDFLYVMWDKRAAQAIHIINLGNSFEVTFDGILWRNDLLGNYSGMPEYDPNLPKYLTVQYDDGTGLRDWVIVRQETTTLPQFSPRTDKYAIKYV